MTLIRKALAAIRLHWRTLRLQLALLYAGAFVALGAAAAGRARACSCAAASQSALSRQQPPSRNCFSGRQLSTCVLALVLLAMVVRRRRARLADRRTVPAAAAHDHRHRAGHLGQQPEPAPEHSPAATTSSPSSARRSTTCSRGWRPRSRRSAISSPTPRTSCAPRSPRNGPCCSSRSPTLMPPRRRCDRPASRCWHWAISRNASSTPCSPWPAASAASSSGSRSISP